MKIKSPKDVLDSHYLNETEQQKDINEFKEALKKFIKRTKIDKREDHNTTYISQFLREISYGDDNKYEVNKSENVDLAIYKYRNPEVIIEVKRPKGNESEMVTTNDLNKKAFREALLYFMRLTYGEEGKKKRKRNTYVKQVIITNNLEWFIIDAEEVDRIAQDTHIQKQYYNIDYKATRTDSDKKTKNFYTQVSDYFETSDVLKNVKVVHVKFDNIILENKNDELINLYKLLTPRHLLKEYGENDSNTLNKNFYYELLHILGLKEKPDEGKTLIQRKPKAEREYGTLLENTILKLQTEHDIGNGNELFKIALELNITWLNRILFLKLLEAKLVSTQYEKNEEYKFLSTDVVTDFDILNTLFFEVLAKRRGEERKSVSIEIFKELPYLNSSLFEPTELEKKYLRISNLKDNLTLKVYSPNSAVGKQGEKLSTLNYLLRFLNSYDFGSDEKVKLKDGHNTLINSAVLGLIFEKINGYKEGSFFTPSFITMYMTKRSIRKKVVDKFNQKYQWRCKSIIEIKNKDFDIYEANELINSITICDPAVGSGHFLVSALNEILLIKSELKILLDKNYKVRIKASFIIKNDELYIKDSFGDDFKYRVSKEGNFSLEAQEIQEAIFHDKQRIIENQLFGVDINNNSVQITHLRLWIELLKHSYYKDGNYKDGELETLPNIDINIKCGNSLISKYSLKDNKTTNKILKDQLSDYKKYVTSYKNTNNKAYKKEIVRQIDKIKNSASQKLDDNSPKISDLKKLLNGDVKNIIKTPGYIKRFGFKGLNEELIDRFGSLKNKESYRLHGVSFDPVTLSSLYGEEIKLSKKELQQNEKIRKKAFKDLTKIYDDINEFEDLSTTLFKDSLEWRFEFPEVMNENGDFEGFDIVMENPPYLSNKDINSTDKKAYEKLYGLSDDLYNYFFTKSFELLKKDGLLTMIVSNTFMTINSKINIRKLLQSKKLIEFMPIKNPFEEAIVEPVIVLAQNTNTKENYTFDYVDLRKKEFLPQTNRYQADIGIYRNAPNEVFFTPTIQNLEINTKIVTKVKKLKDKWWDKIKSSRDIAKNRKELQLYRNSLKEGTITLLGLVTDGGVGLQTGDNGKYIGVKEGTKAANRIKQTRIEKLESFNKKHNQQYLIDGLTEFEIRELLDKLKVEFGRDIFGQGYLFRITSEDEIADVNILTDDEKENGIDGSRSFVPYAKGDRGGNQWYLETPFYIKWDISNVKFLKENSGKKGKGMPVVRNPQFYFREGFSWNNVLNPNAEYIKARLKQTSINDVASMSLYPFFEKINAKYITVLLNSYFVFKYLRDVINNTVNLQINDFRQIPIIVPNQEQLNKFENIFDEAKEIKIKEFDGSMPKNDVAQKLNDIQERVDKMVYELYGIIPEEDEIDIADKNI